MGEWLTGLFTFRNGNHLFCFLTTFPILVMFGAFVIFGEKINSRVFSVPLPFMAILYALIALEAYRVVIVKNIDSQVFSIDCIWYNSFLAVGYLILFAISLYHTVSGRH